MKFWTFIGDLIIATFIIGPIIYLMTTSLGRAALKWITLVVVGFFVLAWIRLMIIAILERWGLMKCQEE